MKFLMISHATPGAPPPPPEALAKIGEFTQRMIAAGKVVLTGGIQRTGSGLQIQREAGKTSVTDGPFAESKELIDGFAIVEVASREEAVALSKEFWEVAGDGKGEILQIFDGGPPE